MCVGGFVAKILNWAKSWVNLILFLPNNTIAAFRVCTAQKNVQHTNSVAKAMTYCTYLASSLLTVTSSITPVARKLFFKARLTSWSEGPSPSPSSSARFSRASTPLSPVKEGFGLNDSIAEGPCSTSDIARSDSDSIFWRGTAGTQIGKYGYPTGCCAPAAFRSAADAQQTKHSGGGAMSRFAKFATGLRDFGNDINANISKALNISKVRGTGPRFPNLTFLFAVNSLTALTPQVPPHWAFSRVAGSLACDTLSQGWFVAFGRALLLCFSVNACLKAQTLDVSNAPTPAGLQAGKLHLKESKSRVRSTEWCLV